jgi:hypothetical protein
VTGAGYQPPDGLALFDQLLHGIGRTAQAHVWLEYSLGELFRTLTAPSLAMALVGKRGIPQIASDNRIMLQRAEVSDDLIRAGDQALVAAEKADELRHRVVHDMWLGGGDDSAPFTRVQRVRGFPGNTGSAHDLTFVTDAVDALQRASIRVSALNSALHAELPFWAAAKMPPYPIDMLRIVRDDFTLMPDGGYRVGRDPAGS